MSAPVVGRRPVLCGAAAACVTALGGCAGYGKGRLPSTAPQLAATGVSGTAIVSVADIPIGSGAILVDRQLVVTRPRADEVHVLSAVCTHQGCTVDAVANGTVSCPCHGSAFSLTGEVTSGPATKPLPAQQFAVVNAAVTV